MVDKVKDSAVLELVDLSRKMKANSYSPYSHFPVGAAVKCSDGTIFTGCNVENAVFPLGVCAEVNAIAKAVSEGHRSFTDIAISSDLKEEVIVPCGACRQFLSEFGLDWNVHMTKPNGDYMTRSVRQLLPMTFEPKSLNGIVRNGVTS